MTKRIKAIAVSEFCECISLDKLLHLADFPANAMLIERRKPCDQMFYIFIFEHPSFPELKDDFAKIPMVIIQSDQLMDKGTAPKTKRKKKH